MANYGCTSMGAISGDSDSAGNLLAQTPAGLSQTLDGQQFHFGDPNASNRNGQQLGRACCNQAPAGSQGNIHMIPQNSCTSITQNLSTSDQQPLIVQDAQLNDDRAWCRYRYFSSQQQQQPQPQPQHRHHHHHSHDHDHSHQPADSGGLQPTGSLKTTSFMAAEDKCMCSGSHMSIAKCPDEFMKTARHSLATFVCDQHESPSQHQHHNELFGSTPRTRRNWLANYNYEDDEEDDDSDSDRKRSRTLTRAVVFKPLAGVADRRFTSYASTNDLKFAHPHRAPIGSDTYHKQPNGLRSFKAHNNEL